MAAVRFEKVLALRETDKALLVDFGGHEVWVPKSVIHDDSEVFDADKNAEGALVLLEWWCDRQGLI